MTRASTSCLPISNPRPGLRALADQGQPNQKTMARQSPAFEEAVVEALDKFGANQPLNGNGPETRVVPLAKVRDVFSEHYKPEGHSDHPQDAIRRCFQPGPEGRPQERHPRRRAVERY
jgi:hypothetical protein